MRFLKLLSKTANGILLPILLLIMSLLQTEGVKADDEYGSEYSRNYKCDHIDEYRHRAEYRGCLRAGVLKSMDGEDCEVCFSDHQEQTNPWVEALGIVAGPLAYFGSAYVGAKYAYKSQKEWAGAYEAGHAGCTSRFNSYLDYSITRGSNPILPEEAEGMMNSCNGSSLAGGGYAGFNGLSGNGFGGFGNGFTGGGYSNGFLNGMAGPYGIGGGIRGGIQIGGGFGGGFGGGMGGGFGGGFGGGGMGGGFGGGIRIGGGFGGGMGGGFGGGMGGGFGGGMGGGFGGGMGGGFGMGYGMQMPNYGGNFGVNYSLGGQGMYNAGMGMGVGVGQYGYNGGGGYFANSGGFQNNQYWQQQQQAQMANQSRANFAARGMQGNYQSRMNSAQALYQNYAQAGQTYGQGMAGLQGQGGFGYNGAGYGGFYGGAPYAAGNIGAQFSIGGSFGGGFGW